MSANTVSSMEAGRNIAFENVVRIAMVLGRGKELEELFKPQLTTLEDLRRYEESTIRQRIKERTLAD
ncbi:XRE family transcriptional regulator [Enterobacter sp. ENT03]|uniref:XRE family transcriptional regulator n=1 Tax=Enterobacter sp. ENT03 TaxID=2854780 RepID=UPI003529317C